MSFLLLVLIGMGLVMGAKTVERFTDAAVAPTQTIAVSPALANLIKTPDLIKTTTGTMKVDTLAREIDTVAAAAATDHKCPPPPKCKECEVCPDMSQYVRLDEVPCWNCSLP
jgi:hypothetical protein